jgi:hypothetical protein
MTGKELTRLVAALLLGAALAFPVGMMLAGRDDSRPAPRPSAAMRNVFSPSVRTDPYFIDRQRENVEALERYCRETDKLCAEARTARQRLDELAEQ